ncbi:unnamed protein product [Rotaria socialis]|uniref:Uncharacterized protein n=1 Tax=Rotaria socialis TaxID=392032 RepID=A0A817PJK4_9BILA|nr:unnamed protein product [Rotaria socialis]CAF3160010.1 unnamed protein product [Rotaria socialis]CAF3354602.1 unnamed protein product [Rotaria socialis]CAF3395815.1 unnamed protein product [Rotaria socialis]CAF3405127.1 unnamed protein product [Rotaria socialis]
MYGNLFLYDLKYKLVAFESGSLSSSSRCLILIGGLSDGLLSLPYVERLSSSLESLSDPYTLIQPLFRSSNLQYGWHTIDDDIEDLKTLIEYLINNRPNLTSIILMGHSTGCQDIIHFLRQERKHLKIHRVILQGPVSDRQYLSQLSSTKDQLNYCLKNDENIKEWLPRYLHDPPLTVQRCLSFNQPNSIEDLFSSDLTDEQLNQIYEKIETPITWIWSKQDEYVPSSIKDNVESFVKNKLANKNNSTFLLLEEADHAINNQQEQISMIEHITQLILSSNK